LLVCAALALVALGGYDVLRDNRNPSPASARPATAAEPATLAVARVPLGDVVTSDGATLYRSDKDTAKPSRSTCVGQCAVSWPPVLSSGGVPKLDGVNAALVGIVIRPDGGEQLTLAGWPLYRYSGDTAPGETRGEGSGGTWHAVGPTGKPARAAGKSTARPSPVAATSTPALAPTEHLAPAPASAGDAAAPAAPPPPPADAPGDATATTDTGGYGY
jgi:predicted lipoprotein with Yx(FWY)xxD motif